MKYISSTKADLMGSQRETLSMPTKSQDGPGLADRTGGVTASFTGSPSPEAALRKPTAGTVAKRLLMAPRILCRTRARGWQCEAGAPACS
jgi:hypothetical protein